MREHESHSLVNDSWDREETLRNVSLVSSLCFWDGQEVVVIATYQTEEPAYAAIDAVVAQHGNTETPSGEDEHCLEYVDGGLDALEVMDGELHLAPRVAGICRRAM